MNDTSDESGQLLVKVVAVSETPSVNSIDLGVLLEKACARGAALENSLQRHEEEQAGQTLGLGWNGVLAFFIQTREQLAELRDAIWTALGKKRVKIEIEQRDVKLTLEMENANLTDVSDLLKKACHNVAKLSE